MWHKNRVLYRKVLLSNFHLNGHTLFFTKDTSLSSNKIQEIINNESSEFQTCQ